ncbi:response regulator transcription factor [bacterium]|nr:response regulator transcription factor [bacterium]
MRILLADDDEVSRLALEAMLAKRGYEVTAVTDGAEAWAVLEGDDPPRLAVLDWMMPGLDGAEVCRRVRATPRLEGTYLLLLTSRDGQDHIVTGLRAGANDYVTKPFHNDELEARVNVGTQVVRLQAELSRRVNDLEAALAQVKQLQGLLPMCSYCKKVRDDANYWQQVEDYITTHSGAHCSHGVCPGCWEKVVRPQFKELGIPAPSYPG